MYLVNKHTFRPTEAMVKDNEDYWRVELPEEFRRILKNTNGGVPDKREFMCGKQARMIVRFLCIMEDYDDDYACYDINVILTQLEERIIPDPHDAGYRLIPIADLFAGDLLCLDYRESDTPTVCVWFHEESDEWNPVTYKVAESFSEFMKMLF